MINVCIIDLQSKLPVIHQLNNKTHSLQYTQCINYNSTEKFPDNEH